MKIKRCINFNHQSNKNRTLVAAFPPSKLLSSWVDSILYLCTQFEKTASKIYLAIHRLLMYKNFKISHSFTPNFILLLAGPHTSSAVLRYDSRTQGTVWVVGMKT